jgi:Mn2+/Fe2+ NRAMP family transporter
MGILGVGLIGVPVVASAAAYTLSEARTGQRAWNAPQRCAGVITVSVLAGLLVQYSPISPMKTLFWSAVINGVVAVPLLVAITLLVSNRSVMGPFTAGRTMLLLG